MPFKTDEQRKAFFAKKGNPRSPVIPTVIVQKGFRRIRVTKETKPEEIKKFIQSRNIKIDKALKSNRIKKLTPSGRKKVEMQLKAFKKVETPSDFKIFLGTFGIGGLGAVVGLAGLAFPPSFALIALTAFGSGAIALALRNFRRFETDEELKFRAKKSPFVTVQIGAELEQKRRKKLGIEVIKRKKKKGFGFFK